MHMLKKHSKIENNEDSTDVTTAEDDATTPTPDPTINPTTNPTTNPITNPTIIPTIYQTTIDEIDQICLHFQKGTCKYGDMNPQPEPPVHNVASCVIPWAILSFI